MVVEGGRGRELWWREMVGRGSDSGRSSSPPVCSNSYSNPDSNSNSIFINTDYYYNSNLCSNSPTPCSYCGVC